ncbi:unnamed protein product [Caenorhabditis bovis]|uniref:DUF19 domain-containing protein n=1 Tax=Caenorhabditis bovis TaxID=2654633 RepID=A0A8S1EBP1_9PELO|nr:unnamed protein product [Caenorhabditis bovis]
MLANILAINVFVYVAFASAVQNELIQDFPVVDCGTLAICNGDQECLEVLTRLYRLDCPMNDLEDSSKRSIGGEKRAGLKNIKEIFMKSYLNRMR